ncbi:MAG: peptide chain release factor N(5)-glutamine methyltransferase [Acidimicrobiia bacterium]
MSVAILDRLPPHERRRLLALGRPDLEDLARRRLEGEPLQYLEGTAQFTDFEVDVDRRVLIPRPETEGLFELVTTLAADPRIIVDLGTGSGVLAIALRRHFPHARVHATDISDNALDVARANAARLGARVEFHHGDLFGALPSSLRHRVDLVVSNPPYVSSGEWNSLPEDVRHEPRMALVAGPAGTEILARIAGGVEDWIAEGSLVVCEIGETQGEVLASMFSGLGEVEIHRDLAGRPRYLVVRA